MSKKQPKTAGPIRRKRQSRKALPRVIIRAIKTLMSPMMRRAAFDFFYTRLAAGRDTDAITDQLINDLEEFVALHAPKTAHPRALAWRVALMALPIEHQLIVCLDMSVAIKRGIRKRSCPPGTFAILESELEAANAAESKPITSDTDPRKPIEPETGQAYAERVLIMAATLLREGVISTTVTLQEMVSREMLAAFLNIIDVEDKARFEATPEGEPFKKTFTGGEPMAVRRYAIFLNGRDSPSAKFALDQFSVRRASPGLSEDRVLVLTELTQPDTLADIAKVVDDWKVIASDPTLIDRIRLRHCNLAAAMALQMELLLQPRQLVALKFDGDGCPILTDPVMAVGFVPLSGYAMDVLTWRRAVRDELGAPDTGLLFPGADEDEPHTGQSLCMSWSRALKQYPKLRRLTVQVMRDIGAVMILRDNPGNVRLVAALLGVKSVRVVERRYKAFLTPSA